MKLIPTTEAVGHVLCHDITQIIPNEFKGAVFKKGHIITREDIPVLLSVGKENIYVWENDETMLHENEAAEILAKICHGENMREKEVSEGKIELVADCDGLFICDTNRLKKINSLGEMMIATIPSGMPVKLGDKLCGTRIIPLVIKKEKMAEAEKVGNGIPMMNVHPYKRKTYGIVTTGSEVFKGLIEDKFTPTVISKLNEYGCKMISHEITDDNSKNITDAIERIKSLGADMIFCTGGMSVDPDDRTPLAIKNTAEEIVSYGAPTLPGAMFLVSYFADRTPLCGLPGCVMYAKRTVFDLVLPRLIADVKVTADYLSGLGNGGLCLNCDECHFPKCSFGKGV